MKVDLSAYQEVFQFIVEAGAISLPMVIVAGLVSKAYNALVSAIYGEKRLKL